MASDILSLEERNDLDKFTKLLALKSAQIIVQSRQGSKLIPETESSQTTGLDWFDLAIPDNAQVAIDTKSVLNGEIISALKQTLCVAITLRTVEGDEMLLETWSLGISTEKCDPNMKVMCTVYYRMGVLLKSLITITRITPAYKLARNQSPDTYSLSYKVYAGVPDTGNLGENSKIINVGQLSIPVGTIALQLCYRTVITFSPIKKQKSEDSIVYQNDGYSRNSPKNKKKDMAEKRIIDLNRPLTAGAFVDVERISELHKSLIQQLPPEPKMSWLLAEREKMDKKLKQLTLTEALPIHKENSTNTPSASAPDTSLVRSKAIEVPERSLRHSTHDLKYSKVMEFPFADGSPITELANFYQECLSARSQSDEWCDIEDSQSASSDSDALSRQLKVFEDAVPEFDNMVASMFSNNSENTD